jgi:hypothetical protein
MKGREVTERPQRSGHKKRMPLFAEDATSSSLFSKTVRISKTSHPSIHPSLRNYWYNFNPKCIIHQSVPNFHLHIVQISYIIHLRYNALVRNSLRSSPPRQDQLFLRSLALLEALESIALSVTLIPHRCLAIEALAVGCPHLVLEVAALLAVGVLVDAVGVLAGVVATHDFRMDEFATGCGAICAIAAGGHVRVAERTARVCAVGVEFAVDFVLEVSDTLSGRGVLARTLLVLASGTKGATIGDVDCCAGRCSGRLMCEGAGWDCAFIVEATESVEWILALAVFCSGVHLHCGVVVAHASAVDVLAVVLCSGIGTLVDTFEEAFAGTSLLLLLEVLHVRWVSVEHLSHHLTLHLHHL